MDHENCSCHRVAFCRSHHGGFSRVDSLMGGEQGKPGGVNSSSSETKPTLLVQKFPVLSRLLMAFSTERKAGGVRHLPIALFCIRSPLLTSKNIQKTSKNHLVNASLKATAPKCVTIGQDVLCTASALSSRTAELRSRESGFGCLAPRRERSTELDAWMYGCMNG